VLRVCTRKGGGRVPGRLRAARPARPLRREDLGLARPHPPGSAWTTPLPVLEGGGERLRATRFHGRPNTSSSATGSSIVCSRNRSSLGSGRWAGTRRRPAGATRLAPAHLARFRVVALRLTTRGASSARRPPRWALNRPRGDGVRLCGSMARCSRAVAACRASRTAGAGNAGISVCVAPCSSSRRGSSAARSPPVGRNPVDRVHVGLGGGLHELARIGV